MAERPYFSICIPQYSRVQHLIFALGELQRSSFRSFEVCISDDVSPEPDYRVLESWLSQSGLRYRLSRRAVSGKYDKNLRSALALASGDYLILMGNDDCVAGPDSLAHLQSQIEAHDRPELVIANYVGFSDGHLVSRVRAERVFPGGVDSAKALYRSFAFVSGLVWKRTLFETYDSDRWDGTEMYQMGLGCAAILDGARTLTLVSALVRKDILIAGQTVDSYQDRPPLDGGWLEPLETTLSTLPRVVAGAFDASRLGPREKHLGWLASVKGLYLFTYPFWIHDYKAVFGFKTAFRLFHTLRPKAIARKNRQPRPASTVTGLTYFAVGAAILLVPNRIFEALRPWAYRLAKAGS